MLTDSEIVGQDGMLFYIASYSIDDFPHSVILNGAKGSGKHLMSRYIADKFNLEYVELDNKINEEDVENIFLNPLPTLYVVNLDNAIPKIQNNLLKVIEEPPSNIFFIGLSSRMNTVLPTLSNRCSVIPMDSYSKNELKQFISEEHKDIEKELLDIFDTPGQILTAQQHPIKEIQEFANNILDKLSISSIPSIFTIADKIAFKNEKDKYDLNIFVKILNNAIFNKVKTSEDKKWMDMFKIIFKLEANLDLCISKQRTFDEALIELKMVA